MPSTEPPAPGRPHLAAVTPGAAVPQRALSRRLSHPSVFLFVILTAQLMVVLDTTIVNVALPSIQRGLDFSSGGLSWVLNGYVLTFGGFLLLGARTGDLLGRRRAFLGGVALFAVSSLLGGLAADSWMLLGARALQGVGAALAAPSALSLLTSAFPEGRARVRAIALYTTVSAAGAATGLVAGGILTELFSWRWVMFVNVPIGVAVLLVGSMAITETPRRTGRFDLTGAITSTLGVGAIVLGLVEAGSEGWGRPLTLASLALGVALVVAFIVQETRASEPILPLHLLTNRIMGSSTGARALLYGGMYGAFFYLSQYFQDLEHYSPMRAGVAFLPWPAAVFLASQVASRLLGRGMPRRAVMMTGIMLEAAGLLLSTRLGDATPYVLTVPVLVLIGAGLGTSVITLTSASLAGVEPGDAGAASGLLNVSQQIGAALGLAVFVTTFGLAASHVTLRPLPSIAADAHQRALELQGMHVVFGLGTAMVLGALAIAFVWIRERRPGAERSTAAGVVGAATAVEIHAGIEEPGWFTEVPA